MHKHYIYYMHTTIVYVSEYRYGYRYGRTAKDTAMIKSVCTWIHATCQCVYVWGTLVAFTCDPIFCECEVW